MTASFTGQLLRPGDAEFADAAVSRVFNQRRPSRRPAAVLCPADVADVAAGVRLAAAEGLRVAVRAGGRSWAAWCAARGCAAHRPRGVHRYGLRRKDRDRHRRTRGARRSGPRPVPRRARAVLRRRALPDGRARRVPVAGWDGLELPGLGMGGRVDRRHPGGDRRRRRRVVRRGIGFRPVLGGPRFGAGVLRRRDRVPAADQAAVPRAHPDHVRVPAVSGGRSAALAARRTA